MNKLNILKIIEQIERFIVLSLVIILLISFLLGTIELSLVVLKGILDSPVLLINSNTLFKSFGLFLVIVIGLELLAVLGTDCACGKMTTTVELNKTLNSLGVKSVLVATGQTCLMQGARYGVSIDALVSQFAIGEIENAVIKAFECENPDLILVEGQGAVGHPAFMSSVGILKGSIPDGIILQHPPSRKFRCDFPLLTMPNVESEVKLIEAISPSN